MALKPKQNETETLPSIGVNTVKRHLQSLTNNKDNHGFCQQHPYEITNPGRESLFRKVRTELSGKDVLHPDSYFQPKGITSTPGSYKL